MSTSIAIAVATSALRSLLEAGIRTLDSDLSTLDVTVTTLAPDEALKDEKLSLNLFLYQTTINAAWRNLDLPEVKSGERGRPPLALNLHYLVTPYGKQAGQIKALNHRILGAAMSVLHDHPVLFPGDITDIPDGGLPAQFERLRITQLPLSMDEMSKLWSALQTNFRVSAAYEVTVVLIDSTMQPKAPLPVLKRGEDDRGPQATAASATVLREARAPRSQPAARLGEELVIAGDNLRTDDAVVRFTSLIPPLTTQVVPPPVVDVPPLPGDKPDEIRMVLNDIGTDPDAWGIWAPGMYTLSHVVEKSGSPRMVSNSISFALAPSIVLTPNSTTVASVAVGEELTITCTPRIRDRKNPNSGFEPIQNVIVWFGDQVVRLRFPAISNKDPLQQDKPTTIKFNVPDVDKGVYVVRLRVDNVDSIPVILQGPAQVPAFDPLQQIRVG
ncbi:DUF4255 domain-containing protein [Bradyrhizobium sp. 2S1]|uniref:DUF4255 domain-containing protein n=1 Tax=Bradyrhizobium sp. 2S1 TaxID=1404429 RepID=UPI00140E92FF|nr:DUF4255 domain-containing protein [Bradyrhizobium sp. 2S1]MCK7668294.1 DUF4255 domain-containing protein [Bradyrhizobium sp. 2S1]